jgi:CDP-diacylglycerol--serine O-phosphatidyltransferase
LRLARFNVMAEEPDRPAWRDYFFTGMPAPAGAIVGLLPLYLSLSIFEAPHGRFMVWLYIAYVLVIALLMASRIPHFSGKKIGRVPRDHVIVVLFGVVAGLLLLATFPMEMLIFFAAAYLATIPFAIRRFKAYEAADAERQAPPPTPASRA